MFRPELVDVVAVDVGESTRVREVLLCDEVRDSKCVDGRELGQLGVRPDVGNVGPGGVGLPGGPEDLERVLDCKRFGTVTRWSARASAFALGSRACWSPRSCDTMFAAVEVRAEPCQVIRLGSASPRGRAAASPPRARNEACATRSWAAVARATDMARAGHGSKEETERG